MTHAFAWACVILAGGGVLLLSATSAARAKVEADLAAHRLDRALERVAELARLRSLTPETTACTPSDLPSRISGILGSCGLSPSAVSSFGADTSTAPARGPRHRASLVLDGLTLPRLGAFLEAWRQAEPGWMVTALDLSPKGEAPLGGDLPLRATVTLEAISPAKERTP